MREKERERERERWKESEENRAREEGLDSRTVALMHVKRVERAGKRGATPEVTKPLNYRLVPLLQSRVSTTATVSGRGLDRPRQYSKGYE